MVYQDEDVERPLVCHGVYVNNNQVLRCMESVVSHQAPDTGSGQHRRRHLVKFRTRVVAGLVYIPARSQLMMKTTSHARVRSSPDSTYFGLIQLYKD